MKRRVSAGPPAPEELAPPPELERTLTGFDLVPDRWVRATAARAEGGSAEAVWELVAALRGAQDGLRRARKQRDFAAWVSMRAAATLMGAPDGADGP